MRWRVPSERSVGLAAILITAGCGSESESASPTLSAPETASVAAEPEAPLPSASALEAEAERALRPPNAPVVDLAGVSNPYDPIDASKPRLASIAMLTPVHERPDDSSPKLGFLRAGATVVMDPAPVSSPDCAKGYRKIMPAGFVCIDDERATLDLEHPIVRATTRRPDTTTRLPYMYGVVTRGGPVYARIPTGDHLGEYEPNLDSHIDKWKEDEESGATYGLDVWLKWTPDGAPPALDAWKDKVTDDVIPWFLKDGGQVPNLSGLVTSKDVVKIDQVDRRNGAAFVESFLHEGRRYNVSTDLRVIPADRFRPIRGSSFHGWRIGVDVQLPVALVRRKGGKKWTWQGGKFVDGGALEWRSAHELTGKQKLVDKVFYYETKEGFYIDGRHGGRVDPAKRMPKWGTNGEKWIDIRLSTQVLVAYEGTEPVYTTLVSSGEGGLGDPEETYATIRGIYRVHTKHISITMDSEDGTAEDFELRDVPYVQYFKDGYALHGAYWHDDFGRPRSHGCINLAPEDARRLFWWTEPNVPAGWHSALKALTGTTVFIHE